MADVAKRLLVVTTMDCYDAASREKAFSVHIAGLVSSVSYVVLNLWIQIVDFPSGLRMGISVDSGGKGQSEADRGWSARSPKIGVRSSGLRPIAQMKTKLQLRMFRDKSLVDEVGVQLLSWRLWS